ncbi:ATP-dependent dethiobiotin synthetase BioD [filamentous cyanobacterium CCP2]|nr:ATP-dependent dethiobiotin synthetase BioD [filamentous cyanobacterium CCP2]
MNALLIAGTDARVGKTLLTVMLAAYWQRYYPARPLGIYHPVQCGNRELYTSWFSLEQTAEETNPLHFQAPLVPPIAAERQGERVKLKSLWQSFEHLSQQKEFVLMDSWGGLGSPMTRETTLADLAWDWRLPVVLVVPVSPGTIAQAVANVTLAKFARVNLKGLILNCIHPCHKHELEDWAEVDLLQGLTNKPVLGCIPHLEDPTDLNKLVQVASDLNLERLIPLH